MPGRRKGGDTKATLRAVFLALDVLAAEVLMGFGRRDFRPPLVQRAPAAESLNR
jgi:hypothetical protein